MSARAPTLAEVINRAVRLAVANLFAVRIGKIKSFDSSTGIAEVQPLLKETFEGESGDVTASMPPISGVPVFCLGGGDFADTYPVAVGDECLLLVCDRSIDLWNKRGGEVDPADLRRHNISDAIALVGLRSEPRKNTEWDSARRVIGKIGGPRAAFTGTDIQLGVSHNETADQAAVLGTRYRSKEDTFFSDIVTILTNVGVQIGIAAGLIGTAATANAVPITGGAAAAPSFASAVVNLGNAASQLGQAAAKLTAFSTGGPYLSTKVKVK
jgi:hypothetical protein